ncbi:hypothetical protein CDD81_6584 [Ophiocordyceps australis]|uniref:Uncharacterized protein n=1 Tax=Ophiocordyceps australis TaxID=1399860 RepID=A0A2C5Y5B0_9HYPO|nr:hypothetical protein CDD81_6584 [Ophiocordyceps australis]
MRRPGSTVSSLLLLLVVCLFCHAQPINVFGNGASVFNVFSKMKPELRRIPSDTAPIVPRPSIRAPQVTPQVTKGPLAGLRDIIPGARLPHSSSKGPKGPQGKYQTTGPMGARYNLDPAVVPAKALGNNPPGAAPLANSNFATLRNKNGGMGSMEKKASRYLSNPNLPKGSGNRVWSGTFNPADIP